MTCSEIIRIFDDGSEKPGYSHTFVNDTPSPLEEGPVERRLTIVPLRIGKYYSNGEFVFKIIQMKWLRDNLYIHAYSIGAKQSFCIGELNKQLIKFEKFEVKKASEEEKRYLEGYLNYLKWKKSDEIK